MAILNPSASCCYNREHYKTATLFRCGGFALYPLSLDVSNQRLFLAALGNDSVEVLDLARAARG